MGIVDPTSKPVKGFSKDFSQLLYIKERAWVVYWERNAKGIDAKTF